MWQIDTIYEWCSMLVEVRARWLMMLPVVIGKKAGGRTITVNALVAESGRDWSSENGGKIIGIVFEKMTTHLDEMNK